MSGEETALLYVRLTRPLDEASQTCVEDVKGAEVSTARVRLRTKRSGGGSWIQWTVLVDAAHGIKKVSFKFRESTR